MPIWETRNKEKKSLRRVRSAIMRNKEKKRIGNVCGEGISNRIVWKLYIKKVTLKIGKEKRIETCCHLGERASQEERGPWKNKQAWSVQETAGRQRWLKERKQVNFSKSHGRGKEDGPFVQRGTHIKQGFEQNFSCYFSSLEESICIRPLPFFFFSSFFDKWISGTCLDLCQNKDGDLKDC